MTKAKDVFHSISYLQYPILLVSLYYYFYFILSLANKPLEWVELNNALVFYGISLSLSTLQDTTKTQNNFSKKIWQNPKKGKVALVIIGLMAIIFMIIGIIGFLDSKESIHKEISFGLIVLGIGLIGLLKAAGEMFENHRVDKNESISRFYTCLWLLK